MSDNHVTPTIPSSLHFPQRRYNPEEEEKREGRYRLREKRREEERTEWIGKGGRSDADARTSTVGDPESFSFLVLEGPREPVITYLGITESGITESGIIWEIGNEYNGYLYSGIRYNTFKESVIAIRILNI